MQGLGWGYLSPIDHENKRLSNEEKKLYKRITVILTGMSWGAALLFQILGQEMYAVCISIGIMMTAGLQWPVALMRCLKVLKMTKSE